MRDQCFGLLGFSYYLHSGQDIGGNVK